MFTGWHKCFMHCQKETRLVDIRQLPIIWFWWPGCSDWSCQRLQRADFQIIYNHIKRWYVHQALQESVIGWLVVQGGARKKMLLTYSRSQNFYMFDSPQNGVFLTKSAKHKLLSRPFPLLDTSRIMHKWFVEDIKNVTINNHDFFEESKQLPPFTLMF